MSDRDREPTQTELEQDLAQKLRTSIDGPGLERLSAADRRQFQQDADAAVAGAVSRLVEYLIAVRGEKLDEPIEETLERVQASAPTSDIPDLDD